MRIVVHDDRAPVLALFLKASLRAAVSLEPLAHSLRRNAEQAAGRQGRERIVDIVLARHAKLNARQSLPVLRRRKGRVAAFVKADIRRIIIRRFGSHRHDLALEIPDNFPVIPDSIVNDETAVLRHAPHKAPERMANIVDILEKVEVIRLDVQNNFKRREKGQKAVRIFAGLEQKGIAAADPDIAADRIQIAAERNGRILFCREQNERQHRGCRGLSVRAADCDTLPVAAHQLPEEFRAAQHRNALPLCLPKLRIIRVNGRRINHIVNRTAEVLRPLSDINPYAPRFQMLCELALLRVAAAHRESLFLKNFRETAHADAADAHKIDAAGLFEINTDCIHSVSPQPIRFVKLTQPMLPSGKSLLP